MKHSPQNLNRQNFPDHSSGAGLLARSRFHREFLCEREEIMRHKWIESEKVGRDIGFDRALVNWVVHHRTKWRAARRQAAACSPMDIATI